MKKYDKTDVFAGNIQPLIETLRTECYLNGVAMHIAVALKDTGGGTKYYNESVSAGTLGIQLSDDKIAKHISIDAGFDAVLPRTAESIELDADSGNEDD